MSSGMCRATLSVHIHYLFCEVQMDNDPKQKRFPVTESGKTNKQAAIEGVKAKQSRPLLWCTQANGHGLLDSSV